MSNVTPQGKSISPTALDKHCQCPAANLYEKHGALGYSPFAAGAVRLGGEIHDAVRDLHEKGSAESKARVTSKKGGEKSVVDVARRILTSCHERFAMAEVLAVEQRFAFYCDIDHKVFQRGRIDYAPFSEGRCDAVIDLKTKGGVSAQLRDTLTSNDMHRQLNACAIACMIHSRAVQLGMRAAADKPDLGSWERPVPYTQVADAIENAPLPEVWILIWDKDHDRPVWRAHHTSRKILRAHLALAKRAALEVQEYMDKPAETWPRTFNCNEPWECPHKARCTNDLADPPEAPEQYTQDMSLVRLRRKP